MERLPKPKPSTSSIRRVELSNLRLLRLELAAYLTWWRAPANHVPISKPNDFYALAAFILCAELAFALWETGAIRPL